MRSAAGFVTLWLAVTSSNASAQLFALHADLPILARPEPVGADFNGDGVNELMAWWSPFAKQQLVDGRTGTVLRTWQYSAGAISPEFATLPDVTGDGKPEFLFSGAGAWVAQRSDDGGGNVANSGTLWSITDPLNSVGIGEQVAVTAGSAPVVLAGASSSGRLFVADPATGAVVARISRDPSTLDQSSFATMVGDAGDLNGDGVNDFAIGAPGRYPQGSVSRIYFIDGRTRTAGADFVPVNALPADSVLGVADSAVLNSIGFDISNTLAVLGDPDPSDAVAQSLMLVGTPYVSNDNGGATALLLTRQPDGSNSVATVAQWTNDTPLLKSFGSDVQNIGDVTGDGISDAAILEPGDGSNVRLGRILILDGHGLLDGFSSSDILQEISDPVRTFSESMRFLGDYNGDGRADLAVTTSGPAQSIRIYSSVPEPSGASELVAAAALMTLRRSARTRGGPDA
jgi:hypothetical protein